MHSRARHLLSLLQEGIWTRWVSAGWLAYGIAAAYKAEVLSSTDQERYQLVKMIPSISFGWWMAILFFTIVLVVFESSFRIHNRTLSDNDQLRNQLADKRDKKRLRTELGVFALQAVKFMLACDDKSKPVPNEEMEAYQRKIQDYLEKNLELSYLARFRSPSTSQLLPHDVDDRQRNKAGWKFRNEQLVKFIEELHD